MYSFVCSLSTEIVLVSPQYVLFYFSMQTLAFSKKLYHLHQVKKTSETEDQ